MFSMGLMNDLFSFQPLQDKSVYTQKIDLGQRGGTRTRKLARPRGKNVFAANSISNSRPKTSHTVINYSDRGSHKSSEKTQKPTVNSLSSWLVQKKNEWAVLEVRAHGTSQSQPNLQVDNGMRTSLILIKKKKKYSKIIAKKKKLFSSRGVINAISKHRR